MVVAVFDCGRSEGNSSTGVGLGKTLSVLERQPETVTRDSRTLQRSKSRHVCGSRQKAVLLLEEGSGRTES
jgi:hypothetical protein